MFGGAASGGSGFSFGQNKPASAGTGFSFGANNNNNNTAAAGAGTGAGSTGFGFGAKPLGAGTSTPTSGGLFGGNNTSNIPQPGGASGFSFGANNNNNTNNAGTTGGLFGAKPAGAASSGGFGFGNNASTTANTSTGLNFGSGANNAAPAASSGGLFGNKPLGTTNTTGTGASLFPNNANNSAAPAMGSGGLFGNKPATGGTSLFGNNNASSQFSFGAKPAMATGGGLFGSASSTTPANGGLFGQQNNQFQQQQQQQQQQPSLQLSAMSKVSELPPDVQNELKQLDEYIQTQVSIAEYLKSQEAEHQELITSVPRDINYLEKSYASTNQALTADLKFVESFKSNTLESFNSWAEKLIKVYLQLTNPMSSSTNDQGQIQGSSKVVIGVSGNRIESAQEAAQQQQQQQQKQKQKEKTNYVNVTSILNSYYLDKIEDFKGKIHNYELILEEVENCVNDLEQNKNMSIGGGMDLIVNTLREEFKLYVELTNEFAEIHHKINSMANGQDRF